jgi:hypothetical protein
MFKRQQPKTALLAYTDASGKAFCCICGEEASAPDQLTLDKMILEHLKEHDRIFLTCKRARERAPHDFTSFVVTRFTGRGLDIIEKDMEKNQESTNYDQQSAWRKIHEQRPYTSPKVRRGKR